MIDEHELDAIGRRSATAVLDEAARIADTSAALDAVLAAPLAPVPERGRTGAPHRTRVVVWCVAAASLVAVTVGALVWTSGDDGTLAPADTPPQSTTVATDSSSPAPETTAPSDPAPDSTSPAAVVPSTTPPTTSPEPVDLGTVIVAAVVTDDPLGEPEELYRTQIGSDVDQLGVEDPNTCSACMYPWGPVVASDGRIVIADDVNARWIVWGDGEGTAIPYPELQRVIAQPVLDADDRLYTVVSQASDVPSGDADAVVYELDDLATPIDSAPVTAIADSRIWITGSSVVVNGRPVDGLSVPRPTFDRPSVEWNTGSGHPQEVIVVWNGERRVWDFGLANIGGGASPAGLPDGSVLVVDVNANTLFRLFPDGTVIRQPRPGAIARGFQVTDSSMIVLQEDGNDLVTRRYGLPGSHYPDPQDPLAGFVEPEHNIPSLDAVSPMIPAVAGLDAGTMERTGTPGVPTDSPLEHSQVSVRTTADGEVEAYVDITSAQRPPTHLTGYEPVPIGGGWNAAYLVPSTDEVVLLSVVSDAGSARLLGRDVTRQELVAIAETMQFTGEEWTTPEFDGWTTISTSWLQRSGFRCLFHYNDAAQLDVEIGIATGAGFGEFGPSLVWDDLRVVDVAGRPALISDNGYTTAVVWHPGTTEMVYVGAVNDAGYDALEIARSMHVVDPQTWGQFAGEYSSDNDGCQSLFC